MNIELRKNGTFYLKDSIYNPITKLPKNTSTYLGSNPIQARNKLMTLTNDPALLAQIPDIELYEVELDRVVKNLQKLCNLKTDGVAQLVQETLSDLLTAKLFVNAARRGPVAPTVDCPDCCYKNGSNCDHYKHGFGNGNGKYKDGKPVRCIAYEQGQNKNENSKIKLPRDFRSR